MTTMSVPHGIDTPSTIEPGAIAADGTGTGSLLGRVVAQLRAVTRARSAWVVRVDEAAGTWTVDVGEGRGTPPETLLAAVVRDRAPAVVATDDLVVLAVPVRRGPRLVGVCAVATDDGDLSPADRGLAELFADYAALALADHGPLAGRSLPEAIRQELAWAELAGVPRTDLVTVGSGTLDGARAEEIFRVVQEALVNVVAHAGAGRVQVGIMHGPGTVTVLVEDDGRGFDATRHGGLHEAASTAQLGLAAMAARARRLDGELEIDSGAGRGTLLRLTVPCGPEPAAPGRPRPSVLVAAERPVVRAGVVRQLQLGAPELGMVSEVDLGTTHDLAAACRLLGPDVLVVEPEVLPADLAGALERLAELPHAPAVVLLDDGRADHALRTAVAAGAKGCVGPDDAERLVEVVATAGRGESSFGPEQLGRLAAAPRTTGITAREREVCELVARGMTDRQIASALHISAKTVEKHVGSLLRKTGARNRTMLVGAVTRS
ncbi:LuxR C-terminal-related transcriptional regulator [Actinomycetospora termitidis]|uniref:LuxR C-terminal-related transcriptional regulator n=1 Tax=Actinomycetospora termitidis TaxID=3053470 RepID=A0ABT7MAT6_9PSEU|nr:response regulator transcription factor family protein [Actinomycetospora sp. Odt1-22]MDL5157780.1 LuxR C-terminal-related transcriptional regulator [Actinomycetospora sp. Odt1-22]